MSVQIPLDNKHTNKYGRLVMVKVSSKLGDKVNKHTNGQTDRQMLENALLASFAMLHSQ